MFLFLSLKKVKKKKGKYVHFGHHLVLSWKVEATKKKKLHKASPVGLETFKKETYFCQWKS